MKQPSNPEPQQQESPPAGQSGHQPYGGYRPYYGSGYQGYYGYGYGYHGGTHVDDSNLLGQLTPNRLWKLFRRNMVIVLSVTFMGAAFAYYYVQKTSVDVYRAGSVIEMSLRKPRVLDRKEILQDDGFASSEEAYNTRLAKFVSPTMLETVIARLRAIRKDETRSDEQLRGILPGGVTIRLRPMTRLIDITFTSTDPKFAADAANAYAAGAEAYVAMENKATAERSVAWLQTQANAQRKLLADADVEFARFKSDNKMDVIEGQRSSAQQSIGVLNGEASRLTGEIVLKNELFGFLTALQVKPTSVDSLPSNTPGGEQIAKYVEEQRVAETLCKAMAKRYTPEHPDLKAAQARLDAIRAQLQEAIRTSMKTIATDLDLLRKQSTALQQSIAAEQAKLSVLEQQVVSVKSRLTIMEREREAEDVTYKGILTRIEEARMSADENTALVRLVEAADTPSSPLRQSTFPLLFFGCLLGLVGGFGLALASDTLADRVASIADIEELIGIKILGLVPRVEKVKRTQLALSNLNNDFPQITEAFAGLRSLLNTEQYKLLSKSILIVSSVPAEGKTIVSCNLAIGSAQSGLRTLLVDFDMRRPRLSNIFANPKPHQSLLAFLADEKMTNFDELPMPTICKNLQVISTRSPDEAKPTAVLAHKKVQDFFAWAEQNYDRIIVDSPPFGIVSDAAVLATLVKSVILVVRPGKTRRRKCYYGVQHFMALGANVIGAIANNVDFRSRQSLSDYDQSPYYYHHDSNYYYNKAKIKNRRHWWQRRRGDDDDPPGSTEAPALKKIHDQDPTPAP